MSTHDLRKAGAGVLACRSKATGGACRTPNPRGAGFHSLKYSIEALPGFLAALLLLSLATLAAVPVWPIPVASAAASASAVSGAAQPPGSPREAAFNVLFLGVDGPRLEMVAVYSIELTGGISVSPAMSLAVPASGDLRQPARVSLASPSPGFRAAGFSPARPDAPVAQVLAARPMVQPEARRPARSGAVFFPVDTILPGRPAVFPTTLAEIYDAAGPAVLLTALERHLGSGIAYYISIDRYILVEIERITGPLLVKGQRIPMETLFDISPGPQDEFILGALLRHLIRPQTFFLQLPALVVALHRYLDTDFRPTLPALVQHYRMLSSLDRSHVGKIIAPGREVSLGGGNQTPGRGWLVDPDFWSLALNISRLSYP